MHGINHFRPMKFYCDGQVALHINVNLLFHECSKSIEVDFHFNLCMMKFWEAVSFQTICANLCSTYWCVQKSFGQHMIWLFPRQVNQTFVINLYAPKRQLGNKKYSKHTSPSIIYRSPNDGLIKPNKTWR